MNRAIEWFARNPVAANLMMTVIIASGLLTIPRLVQEIFPSVELDVVSVNVPYPGASPEEVESSITNRIEAELEGLRGIKRIRSSSAEGLSAVTVELLAGEDVRARLDDIRAAIDAIDTFPDDAEEPLVTRVSLENLTLSLAVSGRTDEAALKRLAQRVRDDIAALPGISDVELELARAYELSIEVSEASLRRFGLRFDDVVQAVRRSSLDLPGGAIKTDGGEILLRAVGQAYRASDFESIALVSRRDGMRLALGQVATVIDGFEDSDLRARFDGEPAVLVQVYRVGDQRSLEISREIERYVDETRSQLPPGIALTVWRDTSSILGDRLDSMLRNARGGFALVVLILALFLRLRLALWVSLGIPISFLGAVALMPILDLSINFISLMAFIVVLGIVVDDAIVVGENTHTVQQKTGDKLRGAIVGAQTIVVPVVFGVFTSIAAFAPILFLPGPMGRISRVVPLVVICCLLVSLLESMLILPAHLAHGRKPLDAEGSNHLSRGWRRIQRRVAAGLRSLIERGYAPLLERALAWRYLTIVIASSLLLVTLGLLGGGWLKFVFMAPVEADFITADVTMAQGTPAYVTARAVRRLEAAAQELRREVDATRPPDARSVFPHMLASLGQQPELTFKGTGPPVKSGPGQGAGNLGEVQLEVIGFRERDLGVTELTQRWRKKVGEIAGAVELSFQSQLVTAGAPIEVELSGRDLESLRTAASAIKRHLASYDGLYDISDSFRGGKQELEIEILPSAEALGLSLSDLARQLRQGFYGDEVQSIQRGRDEVKVMVRYPASERRSLGDVEGMRIRAADGTELPFSSVARARLETGFSTIRHVDRRRVVSVTAEVDQSVANANEIVADLGRGALDAIVADHRGVLYSFEGEQAEQRDFLIALLTGQAIALLVIYTLLAIPLGSYLQPLIIMSAIPFGLVGAAWGHILMGYDFTMYSVLGLVALSGVVVNSSLVMVDFVNRRIVEAASLHAAVREAGRTRFRPILLTSLTTFAGLTPMMFETSLQAQFMVPMAISIAFGVLFSSFITLFLVPAAYLVLNDLERVLLGGRRGAEEPGRRDSAASRAALARR